MPLLKKKVYEKSLIPESLKDDDEVFYCEFTDEVFRHYEEYSEKMFLYNSMVWTCSMTGKHNLTYQEALESEENARKNLKEFAVELRIPILFVASKTHRTSFGDMADDVFIYVKERYFVGENVEASFTANKWKDSHVLQVIAPTQSKSGSPTKNGAKSEVDRQFLPPGNLFKYEIEHLDADDNDISEIMIVDCNQIRRKKSSFSKEKCKLFLKQYVEQNSDGIFVIKPSVIEDFGINKVKFEQIFDGPLPNFVVSSKRVLNGKKQKQETLSKFLMKTNKDNIIVKQKNNQLIEQMRKKEEEFKIQKQLKEEEKLALRKQAHLESIKISHCIKDWSKPKEDLLLENQQKLPHFTHVITKIPDEYFGDILMIMDFVDSFSKLLSTKDFFPGGLTVEIMERAFTENEIAGPCTDIIQMLLTALFNVQDEESSQYRTAIDNSANIKEEEVADNLSLTDASRIATLASKWSVKYQGLPLGRLPLYSVTVSEILRLHLLASGARINDTGARWRFAQRGGYSSEDDPGLYLRIYQPHILKALSLYNVVQLPLSDKLKIINCLINQLLTYADVRDIVEERLEKLRQSKLDLRTEETVERKRKQEYVTNRIKLQKELKSDPKLTDALEKLEKEAEKKQSENVKRINKILKNIYDLQPLLGSDRAYRKYLRIDSVPGFFINCEEEHPGLCLTELNKQNPTLVNAERQELLNYFKEIVRSENSMKPTETEPKPEPKPESEPKPEPEPDPNPEPPKKLNGSVDLPSDQDKLDCSELYLCSTDPDTCIVHSKQGQLQRWLFIYDKSQLEDLEKSLNKRGIREGELLEAIRNDRDRLVNIIEQTPVNILNSSIKLPDDEQRGQKTKRSLKDRYEDANLGYPANMPPEEVLENALLDNILEMEEKISAGGLGNLLVKSREEWRNSLSNKKYEDLEKYVNNFNVSNHEMGNKSRSATPELPSKSDQKEYQDPGKFLISTVDSKLEDVGNLVASSDNLQNSISSLAMALVQVAHAVEPRYLKKPLGHADVSKTDKKHEFDILENWEQSLLVSTSYSQVFLHYGTLDSCVMWSRSALLARCRICRRQKDSENMLLCDNCNLGHHLYCLKPKLTVIPQGDWFCNRCNKEKEKQAKLLNPELEPTKKRRIFRQEDVEEEESLGEEEEIVEDDLDDVILDVEVKLCKACGSGGEIITCKTCSVNYHIECCEPPLRRAPRGSWYCSKCKEKMESKYSDFDGIVIHHSKRSRRDDRNDLPLHNAALQELLSDIIRHNDAWPFLKPVQRNEVPDYYEVIRKPMDFGTIKYKLNMGGYTADRQVMDDIVLVFENCNTYNDSDTEVYQCGMRLFRHLSKKAKELGLKLPEEMEVEERQQSKKHRTK